MFVKADMETPFPPPQKAEISRIPVAAQNKI
jgi:hypothetical protein